MRSDSGKGMLLIKNADVREEFEKIYRDPNSLSFWKNYIRRRLRTSLISKYERNFTENDLLGMLQSKIYEKNMEWNRKVYTTFRFFMYGKIQNIFRNKEKHLTIKYEKNLKKEESENRIYTAKPMTQPETNENFVEINMDRIGTPLYEGEDKFAYHSNIPKKGLDRDKFNAIVRDILKDVKDTDLLAVYTGYIEGKERKEIKAEYGFTERDYENTWRRLLYKLRKELPGEYREML